MMVKRLQNNHEKTQADGVIQHVTSKLLQKSNASVPPHW